MTLHFRVFLLCCVVVVRAWIPQSASFVRTKLATTKSLPVLSATKAEEERTLLFAPSTRRSWIQRAALQITLLVAMNGPVVTASAQALDMEAFAAQQLQAASSTATESAMMSEDEGMCRFGQPSPQKGEACIRAGLSTAPLRKGGVDAFGQVDRCVHDGHPRALQRSTVSHPRRFLSTCNLSFSGDYKRCKKNFELVNGQWQGEWDCQ
jgi:hypothetical protein